MNKLVKIAVTAALVAVASMTTVVPANAAAVRPSLIEEIPCC